MHARIAQFPPSFTVLHAALLVALTACSGARAAPPVEHTGWTLHYTDRVGEGSTPPREVRPDLYFAVLDGVARVRVPDRQVTARLDGVHHRATYRETPVGYAAALAALADAQQIERPASVQESEPEVETRSDSVEVANVPTSGAHFSSVMRTPAGIVRVSVDARWIEQPGDRSVEVVKDFFVAPLERMGAARLVGAVRQTVGLPLLWEVHLVNEHADGTVAEGGVVVRAAEIGNAPSEGSL